jgi:hypothetical protein
MRLPMAPSMVDSGPKRRIDRVGAPVGEWVAVCREGCVSPESHGRCCLSTHDASTAWGARAWDLGASVRKRDRSEESTMRRQSLLGCRSAVSVHPAHGVQGPDHAHAPSRRVNTRRLVCCGVVGREVEGLQRVASPALNSIVCNSAVFSRDVEPGRGLVLAMSLSEPALRVLIHFPCIRPHSLSLTVGEVLVECVCTLACGAWSL